jgi:ABC-type transport system involved in cytochrome bd biosynthesis fused ATPase/permease subunit
MAAYQYAYVMKDVTKAYPGGREVFKGITLSFLPGVKIGVLGVNGAGKSAARPGPPRACASAIWSRSRISTRR